MKTTKVITIFNNVPVNGAKILAGTLLNNWRTTDVNGEISFQTEDDFVAVLPIIVRDSGAGQDVYFTKVVESGDTIVLKINKTV